MAVRRFIEEEPAGELSGPYPLPDHPLVQAFNSFCSSPLGEIEGISPVTHSLYRSDLRQFFADQDILTILQSQGKEAAASHFFAKCKELNYAPSSIRRKFSALNTLIGWSGKTPLLTVPRQDYDNQRQASPLTSEQASDLYQITEDDPRDSALVALGLGTGAEASDIVALDTENIIPITDKSARIWFSGKRIVILEGEAAEKVIRYRTDLPAEGPFLTNYSGPRTNLNRLTRKGMWGILKGYGKRIGLPSLNCRNLRETYIAQGIAQGKFKSVDELARDLKMHISSAEEIFRVYLRS